MLSSVVGSARTQASEREAFETHHRNLLLNLNRRIEIAKTSSNAALVSLLEAERNQIERAWTQPLTANWGQLIRQRWQQLQAYLAGRVQLQVEYVQDEAGQNWWYAFDPRSGKVLYAETENEVICWIEDNRLGN